MGGPEISIGGRQPPLALICLTLFVVLLPLTLTKPGLPVSLKADEAAYYLASLSLWHDGDLELENQDARRLFREYPGTDNVLVMSRGRGEPVYFSIPIVYPLLAVPFVGLLGANGMVLLNAALLMAMVWMGFAYLRRHNGDALASLFSCGFFLLSTAFVYVFWLQAEILVMACVATAFFLTERAFGGSGGGAQGFVRRRLGGRSQAAHAAAAAAALAVAVYSKPMLGALALPLLYLVWKARSWRSLAAFAGSGLLVVAAVSGTAQALTEQPWPYFAPRMGVSLASPVDYLERRVEPRLPEAVPDLPVSSPVSQVSRRGQEMWVTMAAILLHATPEFLFGRHGGFLVYMPFAVLCGLIFLLRERHCTFRWLILASAVVTAVLFVTLVRGQWLGGGGFVGNRYFTAVYPCFLFLVRRVRPAWLTALGFAAAAVFLGPLLLTPLGALVVEPTLQAHVRNQPLSRLPLEWSLSRKLPGYRRISQGGVVVHGRRDEVRDRQEEIWIRGAKKVELNMLSGRSDQSFVFDVRNLAPDNEVELCVGGDCRRLTFGEVPPEGATERVTLGVRRGEKVPRSGEDGDVWRYPLRVSSVWGEQPRWRGSGHEQFYLGAALTYLGSAEDLKLDRHGVEWLRALAPSVMAAGSTVTLPVTVRNAGAVVWPSVGSTPVRLAYHWLTADGDVVTWAGRRTLLPTHLEPGGELDVEMTVDVPSAPGRYLLDLDLVRERVGWLSSAGAERAHRVAVEVVAGG